MGAKDMRLAFDYPHAAYRCGGWLSPLSSPAAALAIAKIVALLWAYPLHG